MIQKNLKNTFSVKRNRLLLLMASLALMLLFTACASSGYNSHRNNWYRSPASTGHNRCGCLLKPISNPAIKLYQQTEYALQA
ncbi:MAG: hypothetical protein ACOYN4_00310 [Bacteroidales bacterium]